MPPADVLIVNGNVFTSDPQRPFARALAIRGNRVAWVGDSDEAPVWRGANTQVIDAGGKMVMPGFIDSHFHLLMGSIEGADLQLNAANSMGELKKLLAAWSLAKADDGWIVGYQL